MTPERFVEKGTTYELENGKLSLYETNCACRDVKFYFEQYVMSIMLSGHKTIQSPNNKFEFFPGTFLIPEKQCMYDVTIPHASLDNPTKCLVLELRPSFVQSFLEELQIRKPKVLLSHQAKEPSLPYFFSNNTYLIEAFIRLFHIQLKDDSLHKSWIIDLTIKEILLRVFQTDGLNLLRQNISNSIKDQGIRNVTAYIHDRLHEKMSIGHLARIAQMGNTTFYHKFKKATGYSPVEYILHHRINRSKIMIQKGRSDLQYIAYSCGFNSYEYFCTIFRKNVGLKPTEYRKSVLR